jgi:signal transduction histidine kinase/HPt (histidine-containing phosphotransfer) domain-containing protein
MHQVAAGYPQIAPGNRARQLFEEHKQSIFKRTDRMFVWLMPLQWLAGIGFALWVSPRTWSGDYSTVHPHVWAALFLGGAISFWPVFCAIKWPGMAATRYMIAIAQALMSALLIHLSGGRIETHFHVFGSLAFLACYRDWRVLVAASAVIALDHFVRGVYFPLSVFGVLTASPYLWIEHAAWVVFEDVFLIISIRQSVREMLGIAERQAALEEVNFGIERTVAERTAELTAEIIERKHAESEMERMHNRLMDASRHAGMAEVATNVIHNVGNVLNSVNISHSVVSDKVRKSKIATLTKTANLFEEHADHLAAYLTTDPAGQKMPKFLGKLAEKLSQEQEAILAELDLLGRNIGHIKGIISAQQSYARAGGVRETVLITTLMENALQIDGTTLARNQIEIVREYGEVPTASLEKHKVMQILVNLVSNAKHALIDSGRQGKRLVVRTASDGAHLIVSISDNGVGITAENLNRIFVHGFTTKKDGHGFGLHSGVLAAREMGGSLTVQSPGAGLGATFTLRLPLNQKDDTRKQPPAPEASQPAVAPAPVTTQKPASIPEPAPGRPVMPAARLREPLPAPAPASGDGDCQDDFGPAGQEPAIAPESVEALRELATDTSDDILTELIDTFLGSAPRILADADVALERRSAASLAQAAHTLRGSCSNFGAKPLQELSGRLEVLASSPDFESSSAAQSRAGQLLAATRRELERVRVALGQYRNNL